MQSSEFSRRPSLDQPTITARPQAPNYCQSAVHRSQGTNGFAVAALVLGILGFLLIPAILALVFGYLGRAQIRRRSQSGNGLAIAGIVLGWVWVGFVIVRILLIAALAV
jgi:hypothetical protein